VDLEDVSDAEVVLLWAQVMDEMQKRGLVRSANNPVGDFAEGVAAERLGLSLVDDKAARGFDAVDEVGRKYQIKGRRLLKPNASRQIGAIRDIEEGLFDFLVVVIFDRWLAVQEIWKIPHDLVEKYASYSNHVRAHILHAKGALLQHEDVVLLT
jgi:hypothetical protein